MNAKAILINRKRGLVTVVKVIVSTFLLAYLVYLMDFNAFGLILTDVLWTYLLILIALFLLSVVLGGLRLGLMVRALTGKTLPIRRTLTEYFLANALGTFTPVQAGELTFAYLVKQDGIDLLTGSYAVVLDKTLVFLLYVILGTIGMRLYFPEVGNDLLSIAIGVCVTLCILLFLPAPRRWIRRHMVEPYAPRLTPFGRAFYVLVAQKPLLLLKISGMALVRILVVSLTVWYGLQAFSYTGISVMTTFWLNAIIRIASFFPVSINGLGVLEGSAAAVFSHEHIGVPLEIIMAVFILNRAISYTISGAIIITRVAILKAAFSVKPPTEIRKTESSNAKNSE